MTRMRLAALLLCLLLQACSDHAEVVVGFLGPLEGKYSDLGVQGRNGAQLALEEANARGMVPGMTFRLLAEDDVVFDWRARGFALFDGMAAKAKGYTA